MCVGKIVCPDAWEQPRDQRRVRDVHLPTAILTSISVPSTGAANKEPANEEPANEELADALVPVHGDSTVKIKR